MTLSLPKPIATYFAADRRRDAAELAGVFTQNASVTDEGVTHYGREAIRAWMEGASTKYSYTSTPVHIKDEADRIVVTSHLAGDFPGSPVDLRYFFVLDGDCIAELEIRI